MKISDLQIGDVLVDNAHAGIFLGIINGKPIIANALSGGYFGANLRCTSPNSFLKACNSVNPNIYRCVNQELANRAAAIALIHSESRDIIYDTKRLLAAQNFSTLRNAQLVPQDKIYETFKISGLFRAVKFAARRDVHLIQPLNQPKSRHGLRCAYALILFFQIAALEEWVKSVSKDDEINWVSNRHIIEFPADELREKIGGEYSIHYMSFLKKPLLEVQNGQIVAAEPKAPVDTTTNKYPNSALARLRTQPRTPVNYPSAMLNWVGPPIDQIDDETWEEKMTKAMMVDAKYIAAGDLLALFEDDKKGWQNLGQLNDITL